MYNERLQQESMGLTEGVHVNDTTQTDGLFFCFQVIADAEIAALEESGVAVPQMAGVTLTSGFTYYGTITSITLTSGQIKLFKHADPLNANIGGPAGKRV